MSSILTNNSSMVALETLRNINRNLETVQNEISTGKKVASAKDNASIWAISTVMSTDVASFEQISSSLNKGSATVGVARAASEQITGLLQDMKNLIVDAQQDLNDSDRATIQADVDAIRSTINNIVNGAQMNGQNLLKGTDNLKVLASLDRDTAGDTAPAFIDVARVDLQTTAATDPTFNAASSDQSLVVSGGGNSGAAATIEDVDGATTDSADFQVASAAEGKGYQLSFTDANADDFNGTFSVSYVATADDTAASVAAELKSQIDDLFTAESISDYAVSISGDTITITNNNAAGQGDLDVTFTGYDTATAGAPAGGLSALSDLSVATATDATAALTSIETLLDKAITAATTFGSAQKQIEGQTEFVQNLVDSMKSGIGSMVDADIEAASAKLQALQVQQQLGVQALSIANSAPQTLLSLFR